MGLEDDLKQRLCPGHFDELEELKRGQVFEDVPLGLWSPLVSPSECERIAEAAIALAERLLEVGFEERRLGREGDWLPERDGLLESIRSDAWDTDPSFHWRFDFLWDRPSGAITFLELNAGDPSGLGWVESFRQVMTSHSLWSSLLATGRLEPFPLALYHRRALELEVGSEPCPIAFIAAEGSTVGSDILCWAQQYEQWGYPVAIADPRRFQVREDGVWLDDVRLKAVLRDTYEELYWPPFEGVGERLQDAAIAGKVKLLNPLCASFWDSKTLWTRLPQSPTVASTFLPRAVPANERGDWVLKPAFDYGGRGVLCGAVCSGEQWETQCDIAVRSPKEWILQRAAPQSMEQFPVLTPDRSLRWEKRYLTWSVFLNRLKFSGLIARAGQNPVVNVHNGGAIFPVYVTPE